MMLKPEIEEFARILIQEVRDRSIAECDMCLRPEVNGRTAKRWREKLNHGSAKAFAATIIPDCIDNTLFHLLHAVDSGVLRISYVASNGNVVDLTDEGLGELAGWCNGRDGWTEKYSRQRFVSEYKDLKWPPEPSV